MIAELSLAPSQDFPIVGIGASAGGIEALEGFFRGLPARPGLALIIVTHLSSQRESLLHEVITRFTSLPIEIAGEGMPVAIDHVYVMPAGATLTLKDRTIHLAVHAGHHHKPVDVFFSSLAVDLGELAVGIVLSGGDGDGTLGIKAIKERGGLTLAQASDGFGPRHPDMPESAISTGLVDFAVPAEEMGEKLVEFAQGLNGFGGDEAAAVDASGSPPGAAMAEIYSILRNQIGHDFSGYKAKTLTRRVQRRMHVTHCETISAYIDLLRQEPKEVAALFRDLLINVTNFFRDPPAFDALARLVVPSLFKGRGALDTVRVWVPGCSTGEEVFSIAMLMREHMDTLTALPRVQIFATDIDEHALSVARAARYPASLLEGISPARMERFFAPDGGSYVVSKDVRELCVFSPHSVIRDPPFSRIDLVSCRNLLIYLGAQVQNQVIPTLHYALRRDGFLFLGSAENVSQFDDLFEPIDKKNRVFRRRSDVPAAIRVPMFSPRPDDPGRRNEHLFQRQPVASVALSHSVGEFVLQRFSPPHLLVNRDGDVIFNSGHVGKFLETPAGPPTHHLLALARKDLRLDLREMLRGAQESGAAVTRESIPVQLEGGGIHAIDLTVEPFNDASFSSSAYLVVFEDKGLVVNRENALALARASQDVTDRDAERELRESRNRLQAMIEEYETALEELKSSNEELISVNEEMQSTNEELEASKEELQSVNEELHTVNGELLEKVDALDRANSDMRNLYESTDVATIFLDRQRRIRSSTPAVDAIFNILPGDLGRPITDLSSHLALVGLTDDVGRILKGEEPIERRVERNDGSATYLMRLAPYLDLSEKTQGVVVSFFNVSTLLRAEERQTILIAELQHRTRNLLAIVQSIARQTLGKGGSLESFMTRLGALSRVQGLLSGTAGDEITLEDIVRLELQAIGAPAEGRTTVSGEPIRLGLELVQTLALALHELATNAVKHGALRDDQGRLSVTWKVSPGADGERVLQLEWHESGVSIPADPTHRGFGRQLIEQALTFTLRAATKLTFRRDGVSCRIEIPLTQSVSLDSDP